MKVLLQKACCHLMLVLGIKLPLIDFFFLVCKSFSKIMLAGGITASRVFVTHYLIKLYEL